MFSCGKKWMLIRDVARESTLAKPRARGILPSFYFIITNDKINDTNFFIYNRIYFYNYNFLSSFFRMSSKILKFV